VATWLIAIRILNTLADGPETFAGERDAVHATLARMIGHALIRKEPTPDRHAIGDARPTASRYRITTRGASVLEASAVLFASEAYGAPKRLREIVSKLVDARGRPLPGGTLAGQGRLGERALETLLRLGVIERRDRAEWLSAHGANYEFRQRWGRAPDVLFVDARGVYHGGTSYEDDLVAIAAGSIGPTEAVVHDWTAILVGEGLTTIAPRIRRAVRRGDTTLKRTAGALLGHDHDVVVLTRTQQLANAWLRDPDRPSVREAHDVRMPRENRMALLINPRRRAKSNIPDWTADTVREAGGDAHALVDIVRPHPGVRVWPGWAILPTPSDAMTAKAALAVGIEVVHRLDIPGLGIVELPAAFALRKLHGSPEKLVVVDGHGRDALPATFHLATGECRLDPAT
jgi:hypothetical protein